MTIQSFRDLEAWQLGMEFVVRVYELTSSFPAEERFGLSAQLRRAASSIPSNVAEGHQRGTKTYRHFVVIAIGSLAEAETQIELAERLTLATKKQTEPARRAASEVRRLLHGLRRSLTVKLRSQRSGEESGTR